MFIISYKLLIVACRLIKCRSLETLLQDFLNFSFCFLDGSIWVFSPDFGTYIRCVNEMLGLLFIPSSDHC